MASVLNILGQLQAEMKTYYVDEARLFMSDAYDNRLLDLIPKKRDAAGDTWKQPLLDGQIAGGSGDYATSRANATAGSQVAYTGPWKDHFQMAFVNEKAMRLTKSSRGAWQPALELAVNSARSHFNDCTNYGLFRSEDGAMAQLASGSSGLGPVVTAGVATLQFTSDTSMGALQRVKIGSVLNFGQGGPLAATNGKGGAIQAGDWTVTTIQDSQITATPSVGSVAPSGSAYVYIKGDAQNGATGNNITAALAGFESWMPTTNALAATSFKGVDGSVSTQARRGIRVPSAINSSVNEAYILGGNRGLQYGAKSSHIFCHPTKYSELVMELVGKQRYIDMQGRPATPKGVKLSAKAASRFSFKALALDQYGSGAPIAIIPDWGCQYNVSWMVDLSKFTLTTLAEGYPYFKGQGMDGNDWFRQSDNSWILELMGTGEVICSDPSKQVVILHQSNVA